MASKILIVDDELDIQSSLSLALKDEGYEVVTATLPKDAEAILEKDKSIDVALLDVWFPEGDGIELLRVMRDKYEKIVPVMMSGHGTIETAIKAIRLGAYDFLEKPLELEKVLVVLKNAFETKKLREENARLSKNLLKRAQLLGESSVVSTLKANLHKSALVDSSVMLYGEKGAGKELCAQIIHQIGSRKSEPFVALNCAALPEAELEIELFGSSEFKSKVGVLEKVKGGTLYLADVSALSRGLQLKLYKVLEEGLFTRSDTSKTIPFKARLICSSSEELVPSAKETGFFQDLFYKISLVTVKVPSLKERGEDIFLLTDEFLAKLCMSHGITKPELNQELKRWFLKYEWPGNIRELKNLLDRMLISGSGRNVLGLSDLPDELQNVELDSKQEFELEKIKDPMGPLRALRAQFERMILEQRLEKMEGHVTKTAESLGIERAHLHRKLKQYDITNSRSDD